MAQQRITRDDLEAKFRGLCEPVLGAGRVGALIEACWQVDRAERIDGIVALGIPGGEAPGGRSGAAPAHRAERVG